MQPRLILAAALLIAAGSLPSIAARRPDTPTQETKVTDTTELVITDVKKGTGPAIAAGQTAVVHYTGWLYEASAPEKKGKEFDSSRNAGHPFSFVLGTGNVIKGWDQGVLGMKVGGRRRLTIPPDLGYGDTGAGDVIPPGATLVFDVDLVAIQ